MGTITVVRHGQANAQATNDDEYDRLSELGHQQARWLGEWLRARGETFDTVLSGSLRRHRETAAGMGFASPEIDPRLNEMDYFNLGRALEQVKGVPFPEADGLAQHMPQVMEAWHRAEIIGNESFSSFDNRVTGVFEHAAQPGRHVLCVTSGGVIAMMLKHLLGLDPRRMAYVAIPIFNSSVHRFHVGPMGPVLAGYNAISHLESADRAHARTHS